MSNHDLNKNNKVYQYSVPLPSYNLLHKRRINLRIDAQMFKRWWRYVAGRCNPSDAVETKIRYRKME